MPKIFTLLLISLVSFSLLVVVSGVSAEESTSPGKVRGLIPTVKQRVEKLEAKISNLKEKSQDKKEDLREKVRNSVVVRIDVYQKLISRSEELINKLQTRVNTAKAAGKDVKEAEAALADAGIKLADAQTKLAEVEALKVKVVEANSSTPSAQRIALDKKEFRAVQAKLQLIHKDLNAIRLDAAKVIRVLGQFNSRVEATKSATPLPAR